MTPRASTGVRVYRPPAATPRAIGLCRVGCFVLFFLVPGVLSDDRTLDRISLPSTTPTSQRFKDVVAIMEQADATKDEFACERLAQQAETQLSRLAQFLVTGIGWEAAKTVGGVHDWPAGNSILADLGTTESDSRSSRNSDDEVETAVSLRPFGAWSWPPHQAERENPYPEGGCIETVLGDETKVRTWNGKYNHQFPLSQPRAYALVNFLLPFDLPDSRRLEFQVVGIDNVSAGSFDSTILVTAQGRTTEGLRQQNGIWKIKWMRTGGGIEAPARLQSTDSGELSLSAATLPRIEQISLQAYEEIVSPGGVLEDYTGGILPPQHAGSIANGADYHSQRTDRLLGNDMLGHTGLCVGDVNEDGRDDLYVAMGGGQANLLLVQQEDGTVVDTAKEAHVDFLDMTRACLFADMDNDRDQDLVLSIRNATVIIENEGGGIFKETPALNARTGTPSEFYSIAAADFDKNGFLDLYSTRYVRASYGVSVPLPYFDANNGPPNHLLANYGGWKFEDVTEKVGLDVNNRRFSLAASWEDFDDDGDPDLYVANDFGRANFYVNDNGRFVDRAEELGVSNQAAGMGVSWADYDRDGRMDLYISNMYSPAGARIMASPEFRPQDSSEQRATFLSHVMGNALFKQVPGGKFEKTTTALRHGVEGWSWGSMFVDINNDGFEDLLVPNGNMTGHQSPDIDSLFWRQVAPHSPLTETAAPRYTDGWAAMSLLMTQDHSWAGHQRNVTYLNFGDGTFADISAISGFGFDDDGRALAVTDWDRDGDLDLWIKNRTGPQLRYLRNDTLPPQPSSSSRDPLGDANWVEFLLRPSAPPFDGIGAKVRMIAGGKTLVDSVRAGEGYLAQSSRWVHFGLADRMDIEHVEVIWPDGEKEPFTGVHADGRFVLEQGKGAATQVADGTLGERAIVDTPPSSSTSSGASRAESAPKIPSPDEGQFLNLLDRAALPDLSLETLDGRKLSTEGLLGQPILLIFWSIRSPESQAALRTLSESMPRLREQKWQVIPVCIDGPEHLEQSRATAKAISDSLPVFTAPAELLDLVDLMQQEVLGRPDDLLLPTAWAVDDLGLLAWWGRGPIRGEELVRHMLQPAPAPAGRVMFREGRNYGFMAEESRKRNRAEFFDYYRQLSARQRLP